MTTDQITYLKQNPAMMQMSCLLAYQCFSHYNAIKTSDKYKMEYGRGAVNCASFACTLVNVPEQIQFDIQEGKISGLQNLGKFSAIYLFETDYKF